MRVSGLGQVFLTSQPPLFRSRRRRVSSAKLRLWSWPKSNRGTGDLLNAQALEHVDVMFLFALAQRQMTQAVAAQIQGVEMADRVLDLILRSIVRGGSMPMSVPRVEIKIGQIVVRLQSVRQSPGDVLAETFIKFDEQFQPPLAFERFEVIGQRGTVGQIEGMLLEEGAAGGLFEKDSRQAKVKPGFIGKRWTRPEVLALGEELEDGIQKISGDRTRGKREMRHMGSKKFSRGSVNYNRD